MLYKNLHGPKLHAGREGASQEAQLGEDGVTDEGVISI